jgi:dienelactone hydrolase
MRFAGLALVLAACSSSPSPPSPSPPSPPAAPPPVAEAAADAGGATAAAIDVAAAEPGEYGAAEPVMVTFPSEDGLTITADLYRAHRDARTPMVVLFHQAGWSRGEYRQIAPQLNRMGLNALAVDLRSGAEVNGVVNETARRAKGGKLAQTYVDAEADMRSALRYARAELAEGLLIGWGSSYSAALILHIAGEQPELLDAAVAFSPGEYFAKLGKPETWIRDAAARTRSPVFITSARSEKEAWWAIFRALKSPTRAFFIPETAGQHGSRALWDEFEDSPAYWDALSAFLAGYFESIGHPVR